MQKLEWTIVEWEAKCCQIQSKLLSLLKEINSIDQEKEGQSEQNDISNDNQSDNQQDNEPKSIAHNETIKSIVQRLLGKNKSETLRLKYQIYFSFF